MLNSILTRVTTKVGYRYLAIAFGITVFFTVMNLTQPHIVVDDTNFVIEQNGEPTFRPLMIGDYEAKITRVKG